MNIVKVILNQDIRTRDFVAKDVKVHIDIMWIRNINISVNHVVLNFIVVEKQLNIAQEVVIMALL